MRRAARRRFDDFDGVGLPYGWCGTSIDVDSVTRSTDSGPKNDTLGVVCKHFKSKFITYSISKTDETTGFLLCI